MTFVNRTLLEENNALAPAHDDLSNELLDRIDGLDIEENRLREQLQNSKRRDEMVTLVFDFFLSEDNRPDDWNIAGTTVNIGGSDESIDIVLIDSSSSSGLLVCNAQENHFENQLETLNQLWQTARESTGQLERAIAGSGRPSLDTNSILPIIGLHSAIAENFPSNIESHINGDLDGNLLAWKFTLTENRIELMDEGFPNLTTMNRSHGLVSLSEDGVERGRSSEVSIDLSPTSGMLPQTTQAANYMLKHRAEDTNEAPVRYFTDTMLQGFFDEQDAFTISTDLSSNSHASELIGWWKMREIAETASSTQYDLGTGELYRFDVDSQNIGNIINELDNLCKDAIIDEKSRELAISNFETDTAGSSLSD